VEKKERERPRPGPGDLTTLPLLHGPPSLTASGWLRCSWWTYPPTQPELPGTSLPHCLSPAALQLVDLSVSRLAGGFGYVPVTNLFDFDPDWEIDPASLNIGSKLGEGEFGVVHKAKW
jgi:hypothetical protein